MCECFGNICTCIYCVFVLFRLCIVLFVTSVRTTVTTSENSIAVNDDDDDYDNNNNNNNNNNNTNKYISIHKVVHNAVFLGINAYNHNYINLNILD
jgi:hypothetical protein